MESLGMMPTQLGSLVGASLSILTASFVCCAYLCKTPLKRHPNKLMIWKISCDWVFGAIVVGQVVTQLVHDNLASPHTPPYFCNACRTLGAVTQFFLFASEMCNLMLSFDLWLALRNPFTNYKRNMRLYALSIVVVAAVSALVAAFGPFEGGSSASGLNEFNICWIKFQAGESNGVADFNPYLWGLFFIPVILNSLFAICVYIYQWHRLKSGLSKTYKQRLQAFRRGGLHLLTYAIYWIVIGGLNYQGYVRGNADIYNPATQSRTTEDDTPVASGGFYDCQILRDDKPVATVVNTFFLFGFTAKGAVPAFVFLFSNWRAFRSGGTFDKSEAEAELQPHLNTMLRQELAHYTTAGIIVAISEAERMSSDPSASTAHETSTSPRWGRGRSESFFEDEIQWRTVELSRYSAILHPRDTAPRGAMRMREESRGYAGVPLRLDDSGRVSFDDVEAGASTNVLPPTSAVLDYYKPPPLAIEDLAPQVFSRIRAMFGVQSARFKHSLTHVVKQTFSEGASGAFMCFTGDNRYIIKTMSATEAETLRRILPDYVAHLEKYPESLLAKFFSCTKLTLYTQTLYFVVMENVFRRCTGDLHERYDLKGSWVNRTGRFNSEKTQYRCRYCHEQFHVHDKEECSKRPNQVHVANTLLLDEDLLYKLRLPHDLARRLGNQLRWDSMFLCSVGIMDYSLLLGVKRKEFHVNASVNLTQLYQNRLERELHGGAGAGAGAGAGLGSTADVGIDGIHLASVSSHVSGTHIGVSVGSGAGPSAAAAGLERQPSSISGQVSRSATANGGEEDCKYSSAGVPSRRARRYESQRTCDTEENVEDLPFYCQSEGGMMPSVIEHPGVFYVGIIDVLQEWTFLKRLERFTKQYLLCRKVDGVSAAPPVQYQQRFEDRVIRAVIEDEETVVKAPSSRHNVFLSPWSFHDDSPAMDGRVTNALLGVPANALPAKARSEGSLGLSRPLLAGGAQSQFSATRGSASTSAGVGSVGQTQGEAQGRH